MINLIDFTSFLRCPYCQSILLTHKDQLNCIVCEKCNNKYPLSVGRPILIRPDNDIFCIDDYCDIKRPSNSKNIGFLDFIPSPSVNLASQRVLLKVRELLKGKPCAFVLVVGSGCQKLWLDSVFCVDDSIKVLYTDIDISADVDLFCDGHDLPFVDGVFDAVVTTAVLEHVLYPERVASEIMRVLKKDGLFYSELPFMQQVHEGAYDFTRYTMSGHRRLFNQIVEIESGVVAGPGTTLVWSIENFALAFLSNTIYRKMVKATIRFAFGWIKYSDYILRNSPAALDGASCTYLLGYKIDYPIPDADIISGYVGAQTLTHT